MEEIKGLESLGALSILAIIVFRLPNIISAVNEGIKLVIDSVMSTQDKALKAFENQLTKDREMYITKFDRMEDNSKELIDSMNNGFKTIESGQEKIIDKLRS